MGRGDVQQGDQVREAVVMIRAFVEVGMKSRNLSQVVLRM